MEPHELELLMAELADELEPIGWSVLLDQRFKAPRLVFTHPLTQPWSYGLSNTTTLDNESLGLRRTMAAHRDFEEVRLGPRSPKHGPMISSLRVAAGSYGWTPELFAQVVWTLRELEVIDLNEAKWLEKVGPYPRPPGVPPAKLN